MAVTPRFDQGHDIVPELSKKEYTHIGPGSYSKAHEHPKLLKETKNAKIQKEDGLFFDIGVSEKRIHPVESEAGLLPSYFNLEQDAQTWHHKGLPFSVNDRGLVCHGYDPHLEPQPDCIVDAFMLTQKMNTFGEVDNLAS